MQTLSFNTKRDYTEFGQRIAAARLESGEIIMLDVDRHIDMLLPAQIEFTQSDIMWAYDHNIQIFPADVDLTYGVYYDVIRQLRDIAMTEVACI